MMIGATAGRQVTGNNQASASSSTGGGQFTVDLNTIAGLQSDDTAARKLTDALKEFKAEAAKTPRQRCRDQIMKEWHISEETLKSLPPKEAKALEGKIEAEVARRMQTSEKTVVADAASDAEPEPAAPGPTAAVEPSTISTMDMFRTRPGLSSVVPSAL